MVVQSAPLAMLVHRDTVLGRMRKRTTWGDRDTLLTSTIHIHFSVERR
jgi:hypothetical protein